MNFFAQGRLSDSPYVESIWRGAAESDTSLMCPADGRWNIRFVKLHGKVQVSIEGPMTRALPKTHVEGVDWLVIKFRFGTFLRDLSTRSLLDGEAILSPEAKNSFWLGGSTWQIPDYDNADTFVDWLIRKDILLSDPVVKAVLADQPHKTPLRTVRHRFLQATGLTQSDIRQIERARHATTLLEQGRSILDVVELTGYADQSHMTRSLKRFMGETPAHFSRMSKPESSPLPYPYAALLAS